MEASERRSTSLPKGTPSLRGTSTLKSPSENWMENSFPYRGLRDDVSVSQPTTVAEESREHARSISSVVRATRTFTEKILPPELHFFTCDVRRAFGSHRDELDARAESSKNVLS